MRRKKKRNERKRIRFILAPLIFIICGGVVTAFLIFTPMLTDILQDSQIKSAYIHKATQEQVSQNLNEKKVKFEEIEQVDEGETFQVTLTGGEVVKLASSKDIDTQINTLHDILRRLTIDNKNAKRIDLRFSKPIVTLY